MNLQSLLDTLRRLYLNDRSDRTAGTSDYLWEDADLVMYIDEAQRRFATQSYCIHDSVTPEIINVTIVAAVDQYILHPAIIDVLSARISTASVDLTRVGHSLMSSYTNPTERILFSTGFEQLSPGPPLAFSTDETIAQDDDGTYSALQLRVYPVPRDEDAGTVIKLRTVRKPLDTLTINNLSAVPEIPIDHHLEMLDWAAYLALRIVDHDAGDDSRADKFASTFESHVENARKLVLRKLAAPDSWGFGRSGWAWGSPISV